MKILFLNPYIDSEHNLVRFLVDRGIAPLIAVNPTEAWQLIQLHGQSIDLGIVHREGVEAEREPGLEFVKRFKADPLHSDLPYILTTDLWSDAECVRHQESNLGANAYLRSPYSESKLLAMIEAVTGESFTGAMEPPVVPPPISAEKANDFRTRIGMIRPDDSPSIPTANFDEARIAPPLAEAEADILDVGEVSPPAPTDAMMDSQVREQMGYLFSQSSSPQGPASSIVKTEQPIGDAVVPGGAAQSPDVETLKRFLMLREQDVSVLSNQLKVTRERVQELEKDLSQQKSISSELSHEKETLEKKIEQMGKERESSEARLKAEIESIQFELKAKRDKGRVMEQKVRDAYDEIESIKDRVRADIRKIRIREKELENRLEILKKDSEALLTSRENKIVELKRKLDLVEFNMDLLQEKHGKEQGKNKKLKDRLLKAAQAMKVADGLLGSQDENSLLNEMFDDFTEARGPDTQAS